MALCGGAGGDLWPQALASGAELFATADLRYHECLEILGRGMALMICDHGEMERPSMLPFSEELRRRCGLPVELLPEGLPGHWRRC